MDQEPKDLVELLEQAREDQKVAVDAEAPTQPRPEIMAAERAAVHPAARCGECGVVTWRMTLIRGAYQVKDATHADGCSKPPGRFDRAVTRDGILRIWRKK